MQQKILQRVNKSIIVFVLFFLFCNINIYANENWSGNKLTSYVKQVIKKDIVIRYPGLSEKDIKIRIKNSKDLDQNKIGGIPKIKIPKNWNPLGNLVLPVRFYTKDGSYLGRISVFLHIKAYRNYLESTRVLKTGEVFVSSDVKIVYRDINYMPLNAVRNLEEFVGKEASSTISEEVILTKQMVKEIPDIRRGQKVTLHIKVENVQLKLSGIALEDGTINKDIRVKSMSFNKELTGKVVDKKNVKIEIIY